MEAHAYVRTARYAPACSTSQVYRNIQTIIICRPQMSLFNICNVYLLFFYRQHRAQITVPMSATGKCSSFLNQHIKNPLQNCHILYWIAKKSNQFDKTDLQKSSNRQAENDLIIRNTCRQMSRLLSAFC